MGRSTPPPPPPPPVSPPPPPQPSGPRDRALAAYGRGQRAVDDAVERLGERSAALGLDVHDDRASVWPVLGVSVMTVALVIDRVRAVHAVPLRWTLFLVALGLLVVAAELRRGGRIPALDNLPREVTSTGLRLVMLLVLAAQLTNFLALGVTQVLWWVATALVAIPVVRRHQAVRAFRAGGRDISPAAVGGALALVALLIGLLPGQGDVGALWGVVAAAAAAAILVTQLAPDRLRAWVLLPAAALVAGVAVTAASLTVVGLCWMAAGWLTATAAWRLAAGATEAPRGASLAQVAMIGALIAVAAMLGKYDNNTTPGYYSSGHTYSYDPYSGESGYQYDAFAYYNPGVYYETSGRGKPWAPLAAAGLLALAALARRREVRGPRIGYVAIAGVAGTFVWVVLNGDYHYVPVWLTTAGIAVTAVWLGREVTAARAGPAAP